MKKESSGSQDPGGFCVIENYSLPHKVFRRDRAGIGAFTHYSDIKLIC